LHAGAGSHLIAHKSDILGSRADKGYLAGFADFREVGVFGKEPVPRVDCFYVGNLGSADNRGYIQITVGALGASDADGLIGKTHVKRISICLGIHRDAAYPKFFAGAYNPKGYFAPVGNEYLRKHVY
jgi:hypothetical protein